MRTERDLRYCEDVKRFVVCTYWVAGVLVLGCTGSIGESKEDDPIFVGRTPSVAPNEVTCEPAQVGAPVPMRRLTSRQLAASVADVLGNKDAEFPISDERLQGYRANISSAVDTSSARSILRASETIVSEVADRIAATAECETDCVGYVVGNLGRRLFRRTLSPELYERYQTLYEQGVSRGNKVTGVTYALTAMLGSPNFLYMIETVGDDGNLDDFSIASRLSYALWGTAPDKILLNAAEAKTLRTSDQVIEQAERMIDDPRFEEGLREFVHQWLELEKLEVLAERPDFAELTEETQEALLREPVVYLMKMIREGGSSAALLSGSETLNDPHLSDIYGEDVLSRDGETLLLDPARRAGILTLPGVQGALAHAYATSPTLRGRAVLANLLCSPPPPPPVGVVPSLPEVAEDATTRERLEAHFSDPTCATCHESMDGVGFSFEKYDWFGRYRTEEFGMPIDTAGRFQLGDQKIVAEDAIDLSRSLATRWDVSHCVSRQWTRFATGIEENSDSDCLMDHLAFATYGNGSKLLPDGVDATGLRAMVLSYLSSDRFRKPNPSGERQ